MGLNRDFIHLACWPLNQSFNRISSLSNTPFYPATLVVSARNSFRLSSLESLFCRAACLDSKVLSQLPYSTHAFHRVNHLEFRSNSPLVTAVTDANFAQLATVSSPVSTVLKLNSSSCEIEFCLARRNHISLHTHYLKILLLSFPSAFAHSYFFVCYLLPIF